MPTEPTGVGANTARGSDGPIFWPRKDPEKVGRAITAMESNMSDLWPRKGLMGRSWSFPTVVSGISRK